MLSGKVSPHLQTTLNMRARYYEQGLGGGAEATMAASLYEPSPRFWQYSCVIEGRLYTWGGGDVDVFAKRVSMKDSLSFVHIYEPYTETWTQQATTGTPPPACADGACASIGHHFYTYGGFSALGSTKGSLHQLDTRTLEWTTLPNCGDCPMRKQACGMVAHDNNLVLFGGTGIPSAHIQHGSEFIPDRFSTEEGSGWTNELNIYDIKTGEDPGYVPHREGGSL